MIRTISCRRARAGLAGVCCGLLAALSVGCADPGIGIYLPPPPCAWFCTPPSDVPRALVVRGANLVGFQTGEYVGPGAKVDQAVQTFSSLGGNWIAVNFWWFQDGPDSVEIQPDPGLYTVSNEAVAAAVCVAHQTGLNVVLRPMIDLRDGTWRGLIRPSRDWFDAYRMLILDYAQRAGQWNVEAFSVGVELAGTESAEAEWRRVVQAVRASYAGTVVYCANFDSAARLRWWDAVDVIGIDAYYAIALQPGADVHLMTCAWSYWLDLIEGQIVTAFPKKPVWLTEVGIRSVRGAARLPWCGEDPCFGLIDGNRVDLAEQANYYRATLLAAGGRRWLQGVFWWSWNVDPDAAYIGDTDYSPQGKPAEDVLAEFWAEQD